MDATPLAAPRAAPLGIQPSRCNRCGGCRRESGCGAILDLGGEALVIDAATCDGCGRCAPACRARAIGPLATITGEW